MNRIVLEHYPASKLPKDMRGDIDASALVKVVVEEESLRNRKESIKELRRQLDEVRAGIEPVTTEEAVARVRALRDEWES